MRHDPNTRERLRIFTVGHSTRTAEEFIALLRAHRIEQLVDVRAIPRSRHNPQFAGEALSRALQAAGIAYHHMKVLGGLRHARRDSINTGWRNASFRGYADYMQTAEFERALEELIALARARRTAIMCAEAVPWRCHRSLIADALLIRDVDVEEIASTTTTRPHALTSFAQVNGTRIIYPAAGGHNGDLFGDAGQNDIQ